VELTQLEYFYETACREHITQTAEALNITQPALSKAIARLEGDLGVKLFQRDGKNIRLNEYGKVAFRYTQQLMYTIGDMRAELDELSTGQAGVIHLGTSLPAERPNGLLDRVESFIAQRPDVEFHLQQFSTSQLEKALENREVDLAIVSTPMQEPGIHWVELFQEPMGVILSRHHPLAAREKLSLTDLRRERFYCNDPNSDVQELTYRWCAQAGFHPHVHFECELPEFIGYAVSQGHGISIIARRGYDRSLEKPDRAAWEEDLVYRPLQEDYCRRVCGIAYLEGRYLPRAVREFYDLLLSDFTR
jgi:DNA-binding transcriptional LysR family regulator